MRLLPSGSLCTICCVVDGAVVEEDVSVGTEVTAEGVAVAAAVAAAVKFEAGGIDVEEVELLVGEVIGAAVAPDARAAAAAAVEEVVEYNGVVGCGMDVVSSSESDSSSSSSISPENVRRSRRSCAGLSTMFEASAREPRSPYASISNCCLRSFEMHLPIFSGSATCT